MKKVKGNDVFHFPSQIFIRNVLHKKDKVEQCWKHYKPLMGINMSLTTAHEYYFLKFKSDAYILFPSTDITNGVQKDSRQQ